MSKVDLLKIQADSLLTQLQKKRVFFAELEIMLMLSEIERQTLKSKALYNTV